MSLSFVLCLYLHRYLELISNRIDFFVPNKNGCQFANSVYVLCSNLAQAHSNSSGINVLICNFLIKIFLNVCSFKVYRQFTRGFPLRRMPSFAWKLVQIRALSCKNQCQYSNEVHSRFDFVMLAQRHNQCRLDKCHRRGTENNQNEKCLVNC